MKIVHIITSMNKGGAETSLFKILKYSSSANADIRHNIISFSNTNYYEKEIKELGYNFYKVNFKNKFFFYYYFFSLYKLLKMIKPDVVQCWMYHSCLLGGMASKLLKVNKIIWCIRHSNYQLYKTKFLTILIIKFCAIISKIIPTDIVYCSSSSSNFHKSIGYDNNKKKLIFNGYDADYFKTNVNKNLFTNKPVIFGLIGRYNPQKNHELFIHSLSNIIKKNKSINIKVYMYGKNIDCNNKSLNKLINSYNLESIIMLKGYCEDVRKAYQSIDFLTLSSSFGESFPNVLAEAMLMGVPCISTNIGEAKNILSNYGKIVEIDNSESLSKAINDYYQLFKTPKKYYEISMLSREHIKNNYSIKIMFTDYYKLWTQ